MVLNFATRSILVMISNYFIDFDVLSNLACDIHLNYNCYYFLSLTIIGDDNNNDNYMHD